MVAQCPGVLRKSGRLPLPSGLAGIATERAALAPTPGKIQLQEDAGHLPLRTFFVLSLYLEAFNFSTSAKPPTRGLRGIAVHGSGDM